MKDYKKKKEDLKTTCLHKHECRCAVVLKQVALLLLFEDRSDRLRVFIYSSAAAVFVSAKYIEIKFKQRVADPRSLPDKDALQYLVPRSLLDFARTYRRLTRPTLITVSLSLYLWAPSW